MAKLGSLVVNIGANTRDLNKKLGAVRRDMRSMSSNFKAVGANMTRSLSLPLLAIGAASANLAVEFQSSMAAVKAVSGATAGEFKALEQSAKDLGASTVFTARDVAALQLEYSRLGFSASEIMLVQEATLNLAQATGSDLAAAAEVAGSTVRQFGLNVLETGRVTDVMAASFSASALTLDTFQDSMSYVGPVAKTAGVSLEETAAMLAVLANSGIKGSKAGTSLKRILEEMQGTSGTLTERFAQLGEKGITLTGAMDEVGRRSATSLIVLSDGADQLKTLTGEFEDAEGAAQSMADIMNDTSKGGIKEMTSALEGAGIALGEVLIPFIAQAATFIKDLATDFKALSEKTQGNIVSIGLLVAALGPLMIILPGMVSALPIIGGALVAMTGPVGLVVIGVTALALAFNEIVKATTDVPTTLEAANAAVKDHTTEVRYLVDKYKDEKLSLEDRETILKRLNTIDATHFTNLEAENTTYTDLVKNLDSYTAALRRNYLEKSFAVQGEELFTQLAADESAIRDREIMIQRMQDVVDGANRFTKAAALENLRLEKIYLADAEAIRDDTLESIEAFEEEKRALLEKYASTPEITPDGTTSTTTTTTTVTPTGGGGGLGDLPAPGSINELKKNVELLTDKLYSAVIGTQLFATTEIELAAATKLLDDALGNTTNAVTVLDDAFVYPIGSMGQIKERLADLQNELLLLNPLTQEFADKMIQIDELGILVNGSMEEMKDSVNVTSNAFKDLGKNISNAFVDAVFEAENFGAAMVQIGKQILKTLLSEAIGSAIASAASNKNIANQASGGLTIPGFILGAVASVKSAFNGVPALAGGGLAFGETMSIVGDNRNAAIDPEVIAPLSKLKEYMNGGGTNVYGRISGDDIVLSNSRGSRDRNRFV